MHLKKFYIIAFAAILAIAVVSCVKADSSKQVVDGTCPADVKTVYVFYNADTQTPADSIQVTNGQFYASLDVEKNTYVCLQAGLDKIPFFADGEPVTVDFNKCTSSGSKLNTQLGVYTQQLSGYNRKLNELVKEYKKYYHEENSTDADKQKMAELEPQMQEIADKIDAEEMIIFNANRTNLIGAAFLSDMMYDLNYAELKAVLSADNELTRHPLAEPARKRLEELAKQTPGKQYTDLTLRDVSGNSHQLSEWVGKGNYVLIDCWASWCAPCCAEMPNVVSNYNKYHSKGFEVIGISLDSKVDSWKKAIDKLQLPWVNLSDLKGRETAAVSAYGIKTIPASILIDPQGKIVAMGLRGDKLSEKLQEIYGE